MPDEEEKFIPEQYEPPKLLEKKKLEIKLFSDEPMPWGP